MEGFILGKKNITIQEGRKRTDKIVAYKRDLFDTEKRLVLAEGLAFTGKTLNAIESGMEQVLDGTYDKLVVIRPYVPLECGLLPGDVLEKMSPFTRQSAEYVNNGSQLGWERLIALNKIEILPADALQGNHFKNCFVVIDEAQNIHRKRTFKVMTRVGDGAKFVIIGDTSEGQENDKIKWDNLLKYVINKFQPYNHPNIAVHSFYDEDDILGDDFTKFIITTLMPDFM
jgi:predicted ribonuclease YlaK